MMLRFRSALVLLVAYVTLFLAQHLTAAIYTGDAPGLAAGVVGGGDIEPVYPKDIVELKAYLKVKVPRVIILNKTYDLRNSEGNVSEIGCRPISNRQCIAKNNGFVGQDVILQSGGFANICGCIDGVPLWFAGDDIFVQNIHMTNLNPHLIWGGDTIYIQGKDGGNGTTATMERVWIDHVKVSLIGRQMMTTNLASVKSLTISNSDFDGETPFSTTCDGRHYWTFIFYGTQTRISLIKNYVHSTSGRSPKFGGSTDAKTDVVCHAVNNYWADNSGFSFDVAEKAFVLIEGNYFEGTANPNLHDSTTTGASFVPVTSNQNYYKLYSGRKCILNVLSSSGALAGRDDDRDREAERTYLWVHGGGGDDALKGLGELRRRHVELDCVLCSVCLPFFLSLSFASVLLVHDACYSC